MMTAYSLQRLVLRVKKKYRHVQLYTSLFVKSMLSKWDVLVYLDLFAGCGRSQIRGTGRIVNASPLLILGIPETYNKYIFCEQNTDFAQALKARCQRDFPSRNVKIINENANAAVEEIIAEMPRPGKTQKVLGFCFLDPFQMQNLRFSTIKELSRRFMDFLVLIPSSMDANRMNEITLSFGTSQRFENFLGNARLAYSVGEGKDIWQII